MLPIASSNLSISDTGVRGATHCGMESKASRAAWSPTLSVLRLLAAASLAISILIPDMLPDLSITSASATLGRRPRPLRSM